MTLRHGVRRVGILPLSNVECLLSFYFSTIEYGTEVIAPFPSIGGARRSIKQVRLFAMS